MSTRQELIDTGKIWQVHPDGNFDCIMFEGNKTACKKYLQDNGMKRLYKTGKIRLGKVIFEQQKLSHE